MKKIKVVRFYDCDLDGLICPIESIAEQLRYDIGKENNKFKFLVEEMTQEEIDSLPEWEG